MIPAIGTLLCWNRAPSAATLFWHEVACGARIVLIDELGQACRIAIRPPAGVRMTSLPPGQLSFLQHGNRPEVLAEALARFLGGARSPRVLTTGDVDDPDLLTAAIGSFRPDIVDEIPQPWQRHFDERAIRRRGQTLRMGIDEIVTFDLPPAASDAPLPNAIIRSGKPATVLLPDWGSGATRVVLHLLGGHVPPPAASIGMSLDDRVIKAKIGGARVEAIARDLPEAACHILRIGHDMPGRALAVTDIEIGPAP